MSFESMMKDNLTIKKSNGDIHKNVKGHVSNKGTIRTFQSKIIIEPGDIIQRNMSNGGIDTFEVIEPGFSEGSGRSIPPSYNMRVKNLSIKEAEKAIHSITYNINGENSRVYNNSVDNSTNTVIYNEEIARKISELHEEIAKSGMSESEKLETSGSVNIIEAEFKKAKPNKTVIRAISSSLPNIGSIASIGSFIVAALGGL